MSQTARTETKKEHPWNVTLLSRKEVTERASTTKLVLAQVINYVDFRFGHDGIFDVCKKKGIDLDALPQGHFIACFNTAKTSVKLVFSREDIFYHRESRKLDERVLEKILNRLNMTGKAQVPEAVRDFLVENLKRKGRWADQEAIKNNVKIN